MDWRTHDRLPTTLTALFAALIASPPALAVTPVVVSDSVGNAARFDIGDDGFVIGPIIQANSPDQIGYGGYGNALGDFDLDGTLDYLVSGAYAFGGFTRPIPSYTWVFAELHRGGPGGTFSSGVNVAQTISENFAGDLGAGDFNEDGILDFGINCPNFAQTFVYMGAGNGAFTGALRYTFTNNVTAHGLDVADVNGDGHLDLVTSRYTETTAQNIMHFMLLLGDGRGGFTRSILAAGTPNNAVTQTWGTSVADFDNDGRADLVASIVTVGIDRNLLLFYKGNGDGTFQSTPILTGVTPATYATAGMDDGDFNHDGRRDLIVAIPQLNGVLVMFGNGDGTFTASSQGVVPTPFAAIDASTVPTPVPNARPASPFTTSASRLDFTSVAFGTPAPGQTLTITSPTPGVAWTATTNSSWLRVSASSGTTPSTITVTTDATGLYADVWAGGITLSAPGYANKWVPVVFALRSQNAYLTLSTSLLTFTGPSGGPNPPSQTFNPVNFGTARLDWTATPGASWLSVGATSGTGDTPIPVSVSTVGLAPGTYGAPVTINATNGTNGTVAVNSPMATWVSLTVTQPIPIMAVSPSALTFSATANGASPASQTLTISNSGSGTLAWSATTDATWLSVGTSSGNAPASITVSANVAGLAAGTYTANVVFTSSNATNSPLSLPVTFVVVEPAPVLAASPSSLSFAALTGQVAASQSIAVSNLGGGVLAWSASSDASWLTVAPASGAGGGNVAVTASAVGLAPGSYSGNVTIASSNAANGSMVVPVSFVVSAPELLQNPGLEGGPTGWGRGGISAWANVAGQAHGGSGYIVYNDTLNALGILAQQFPIPAGTAATMTAWVKMSTTETTTSLASDRMLVELLSSTGATLATFATYSNLNAATMSNWTQIGPFNLAPWAGQTIRIQFRVLTSSANPTTFYVDDVSVR